MGGGTHEHRLDFDAARRARALSCKYHGREGLIIRRLASAKGLLLGEAQHDDSLRCRVYRSVSGALDFGKGVRSHNAGQFRSPLAQENGRRASRATAVGS